jgi:hypothetical protein
MTSQERNQKSYLCRMALRCVDTILDRDPDYPSIYRVMNYKYIDDRFPNLDTVQVDIDYCHGGTITYYVLRDHLSTITALCNALNIKQR